MSMSDAIYFPLRYSRRRCTLSQPSCPCYHKLVKRCTRFCAKYLLFLFRCAPSGRSLFLVRRLRAHNNSNHRRMRFPLHKNPCINNIWSNNPSRVVALLFPCAFAVKVNRGKDRTLVGLTLEISRNNTGGGDNESSAPTVPRTILDIGEVYFPFRQRVASAESALNQRELMETNNTINPNIHPISK